MRSDSHDWRPTATRERLARRAAALQQVRQFFAERGVLEVDTPVVVNAPVTDVHIHSAEVRFPDDPLTADGSTAARFFLHTSPEFAMKRLLASGSGDIYQICHVARGLERGRQHNAEFTLIEWYRMGFSLERLMDEVDALVRAVLGPVATGKVTERLNYCDAFIREVGFDPFAASLEQLEQAACKVGFTSTPQAATTPESPSRAVPAHNEAPGTSPPASGAAHRDEILDLLMSTVIGPRLGRNALTFLHRYPASQAALARLDPQDPRCALRFELYCEGIELANGFHELASHQEQRARFEHDLAERRRRGLPTHAYDERLLAALEAGLPDCSGVALGFDRLIMLAAGASQIDDVMAFPTERA
jgi:lysyl-tRNA synthetase class 2